MTDQLRVELLLDDHRGIYIPQGFAEEWARAFTYPDDPDGYARDVRILAAGPHAPESYDGEQMDAWTRVLDNAVGRSTLPHSPDESTIGWPDDPTWGTPNPYAGWRLDQGSGEDGCVRAFHPDDCDAIFEGDE